MIYLGIGSNLHSSFGNRLDNINQSILLLKQRKIKVIKKSSFYESFSYPNKKNPKFLNIVIEIKTSLKPKDLMKTLLDVEKKLERKRKKKNDPRTCDIDIIDYKSESINLKFQNFELNIPHKSLNERDFVLYPLKEICPNWSHPLSKISIDLLIKNLKSKNNGITKLSQSDISDYVE